MSTLFVVCGLPGVGKTTVAREIAERVGGELLRTDVVRKDLFSDPEYTDEEAEAVYGELLDRARATLDAETDAVVDGTFKTRAVRDRARRAAGAADAAVQFVKVECAEDVVRERIRARTDDASDADFAVHRLFRAEYEPVAVDHVTVDNSGGVAALREQVDRRVGLPDADAPEQRR